MLVDELNLQPIGGDIDADLRPVFVQAHVLRDDRIDLGLQGPDALGIGTRLFGTAYFCSHAPVRRIQRLALVLLAMRLGQIRAAAGDDAGAVAGSRPALHGHLQGG